MSKSVIVIDTPNSCMQCPCCICTEMDTYCGMNDMQLEYDFEQRIYAIPNWCPLKELPKGIDAYVPYDVDYYSFRRGWYDCLENILGE